ncbi:hypothetical protein GCM10009623_25560 [Nocardioides aestuarii]|uniref:Thioesterase family protein n=1 Tax=Nocardioides aestuarii TaxID=252231 RepID=A0ABW4TP38_9ACTN
MTDLLVPHRFRGPARSGNGGFTAGALAALLEGEPLGRTVRVTLRQPPPLDTPMAVTDGVAVDHAGAVVAAAEVVDEPLDPVEAVDPATAAAASASYAALQRHPFPTCFACGTAREPGDGLRIFPGRVDDADDRARVAAAWTPDRSVAGDLFAVAWAALDCVGGWTSDLEDRPMVLGRMTARIDAVPEPGTPYVVVGGARGEDGRKVHTASTLWHPDGSAIGVAAHTWITVDPDSFN